MKKNKWLAILFLVTVITCLIGCRSDNNTMDKMSEMDINANDENMDLNVLIDVMSGGCKVVNEGDTVEQDSVEYCVNDIYITKTQGKWQDISGIVPKLDSEKKVIEDMSYVVVDISVNVKKSDFWWNNINLSYFGVDERKWASVELTSVEGLRENGDPDLYHMGILEGKKIRRKLIYVIEDEWINSDNHFFIELNSHGVGFENLDPNEYSLIYLRSMECGNESNKKENLEK